MGTMTTSVRVSQAGCVGRGGGGLQVDDIQMETWEIRIIQSGGEGGKEGKGEECAQNTKTGKRSSVWLLAKREGVGAGGWTTAGKEEDGK